MKRLRVMTWNIHGVLGQNPRFDLARVTECVTRHAPDVVALQEIDSRRVGAAGGGNPFDALQEALGTYGARAHAISTADGDYGQALISRWPLLSSEVHDLSFRNREPRRAIRADFSTPAGPLRVIATHLGLSMQERHRQVEILLGLLQSPESPTLMMGDFNDWFWVGSVRRALGRAMPRFTSQRTFPACLPMLKLDRVYGSRAVTFVSCRTDRAARTMSDHLPVIAEIEIESGASNCGRPRA